MPRARSAPKNAKEPVPTNFVAYKAGMAHLGMVDDSESPSKNIEISTSCTILEVPRVEVYGARFYEKDSNGYKKIKFEIHANEKQQKAGASKKEHASIDSIKGKLGSISDITALMVAHPKGLAVEQHHPMKFESSIGGTTEDKLNFVSSRMGKEVKVSEIFKSGEFIDVSTVTKGKGWQGTIKRFGTARLFHKATGKVRHIGTLGPFTPGKVLFTVPQAGQLGFNYRTESNKRILKLGSSAEAQSVNPKAGFTNYGNVKNDFIIVKGSVGGPAKRLVRIRKSESRNRKGIKEPKINYTSID